MELTGSIPSLTKVYRLPPLPMCPAVASATRRATASHTNNVKRAAGLVGRWAWELPPTPPGSCYFHTSPQLNITYLLTGPWGWLSMWKLKNLLWNILLPRFGGLEKLFFNQSVLSAMYSVRWVNFSPSSADAEENRRKLQLLHYPQSLLEAGRAKSGSGNSQLGPSFFTKD